ncbi:MAG: hypothetical protein JWM96_1303, partial [Alphaproteobacteria bacterium]|nr:hypothetical protein [Alphaproteobacteria bacterium]
MTAQDIQDRINALVEDLQTKGKGQTINIMLRNPDNSPNVLPLSSDANGVVNQAQLDALIAFFDDGGLFVAADNLTVNSAPVTAASEAFKLASQPHEPLRIAAQEANAALKAALDADPGYQAAKTALDNARSN